uniref:Uncharacterized protein n=1 Tax=Plectus sambesii TaxID=2011161 RepID=A0A914VDA8_9BILA
MVNRQRSVLANLNSVPPADMCPKTPRVVITAEEQELCKVWLAAEDDEENSNSSDTFVEIRNIRDRTVDHPSNSENRRIGPARKTSRSINAMTSFNFLNVRQTTASDCRLVEAITDCFVRAKNPLQRHPDKLIWKVNVGSLVEYRYSLRYNGFVPTGNTKPRIFIADEMFEIVRVSSIGNDVVVLV